MSKDKRDKKNVGQELTGRVFLSAVPHKNRAMTLERRNDGSALASIPMRKPKYLVPPLSWLLPYSSHRRVELDTVGMSVLDLCDGVRSVEAMIEKFAGNHKLTFRESQLAVGQFLRQLAQRGIVALVGTNDKPQRHRGHRGKG